MPEDDDATPIGIPTPRVRARSLGIAPGILPPGPLNAITDVDGVLVGHVTLIEGETAAELLPLVNLLGRVRVASVSALARW